MIKKFVFVAALFASSVLADPTAIDVLQDIYHSCLQDFSVSCVKPKALSWMSYVSDKPTIRITEDLEIVKKTNPEYAEEQRGAAEDIFDKFEDFLQNHELVAKVPAPLKAEGEIGQFLPRSFQVEDLKTPLAVTGRSKLVKKVIVPFLLGLKFKTAILVPLALALIALKTWKALTLGLLSLVLTGALLIFKFTKPKVVNYEVIHYPQHHVEHHVDHHAEHPPVAPGWPETPGYGRKLTAQELAYNAYLQ